ncbi:unknown [Rickettsia conorii str. Malish 7]|uniref:Uncharacterized protein n=1 Tax=Rickettsia conorii (strain ATCC VR-613 / Malish 7) TaxID=272944 RepID=Q92GC7_RICCN|nr:unknown [Rickettsia conorii str. Malish 7]
MYSMSLPRRHCCMDRYNPLCVTPWLDHGGQTTIKNTSNKAFPCRWEFSKITSILLQKLYI